MEQIEKIPVDMSTWKQPNYDKNYFVPVAQSAIKFYENQLKQHNLTEDNKNTFRDLISIINKLMNYKI